MLKTKICNKCGKDKALVLYHRSTQYPNGRRPTCMSCYNGDSRAKTRKQRGKTGLFNPDWGYRGF
jgi:hypothetical protein